MHATIADLSSASISFWEIGKKIGLKESPGTMEIAVGLLNTLVERSLRSKKGDAKCVDCRLRDSTLLASDKAFKG